MPAALMAVDVSAGGGVERACSGVGVGVVAQVFPDLDYGPLDGLELFGVVGEGFAFVIVAADIDDCVHDLPDGLVQKFNVGLAVGFGFGFGFGLGDCGNALPLVG